METKHTATPYFLDDEEIYAKEGEINGEPFYRSIAKCDNWQTNPGEVLSEQDKADLAFIVRAANNHEALTEALDWALSRMNTEAEWIDKAGYPARFMVDRAERILKARAVLAQAKG